MKFMTKSTVNGMKKSWQPIIAKMHVVNENPHGKKEANLKQQKNN